MSSLQKVAAPAVPTPQQSLNVWTKENDISSDGQVVDVVLQGLEDLLNLTGKFAHVDGQKPLQGIFKWTPYTAKDSSVTQDPFDQGEVYFALDDLARTLDALGFNTQAILGNRHKKIPHAMVAHANKVEDMNAWYSPEDDDLTFGTSGGKWHLASDADVTTHEAGHMLLDHFHPNLGGISGDNEGGAIHEGFGDAVAALHHNDPEMSEDFVKVLGRSPSKTDGLRKVNNDLTLDNVGAEVHDRGQVYAGFFWSLKEGLRDTLGLPDSQAVDVALKILMNHAANYATSRPKPADFVAAVLRGAAALDRQGKLEVALEPLRSLILSEAARRGLLQKGPSRSWIQNVLADSALQKAVQDFGGGPVVSFRKVSEVPYLGGVQKKYQQYYKSKNFGNLPVMDAGILLNQNANAEMDAATGDALKMEAGGVDETIRVSPLQALQKAEGVVQREKFKLQKERVALQKEKGVAQLAAFIQHRQQVDATDRILKRSIEVLKSGRVASRLVVSPDGKELQYEFRLGYARCYVSASTETVVFHPEFFY